MITYPSKTAFLLEDLGVRVPITAKKLLKSVERNGCSTGSEISVGVSAGRLDLGWSASRRTDVPV
jgi:hypothetical protein